MKTNKYATNEKPYYTEDERKVLIEAMCVNNRAKNRWMFGE